jgi:DNA-binding Lrp family transcriptional regulator
MAAFERRMNRCVEAVQCAELAGDIDYLLTVKVRHMKEFAEFTHIHLGSDRRIGSYRSLLVLRHSKDEHAVSV